MEPNKDEIIKQVVMLLKMVYDPEIPMNIYDLGLIYKIDVDDNFHVKIEMTLTNPNCPVADELIADVTQATQSASHVKSVEVDLVFEPEWSMDSIPEHIRLELGLL